MYECAQCRAPIRDPHVIACDNRYWHENCLVCALCHERPQSRDTSMFALNDDLLCREHYLRVRHTCLICKRELSSADARVALCQRFRRFVHITCLQCSICNIRLQLGDQFKMVSIDQSLTTMTSQQQQQQSLSTTRVVCAHHHSNHNSNHNINTNSLQIDSNVIQTQTQQLNQMTSQSSQQSSAQTSQSQTSVGIGRGGQSGSGGAKRGRKSRLNTNSLNV